MWKMLAVIGIGGIAILACKEVNPKCFNDMKDSLNKISDNASDKIKNMME